MQSDEPSSDKLTMLGRRSFSVKLPRCLVWRSPHDSMYYVIERDSNSKTGWRHAEGLNRGYRHSTSAYAKLGRILQQKMVADKG